MGGRTNGDEELRAVRSWPRVRHGEQVGPVEAQLGMELIGERITGTAGPGSERASTLDHEAVDHAMECESVVEVSRRCSAGLGVRILLRPARQSHEIGDGSWCLVLEQVEHDVALVGVQGGRSGHVCGRLPLLRS
jgi:hypothetical protein